MKKRSRILLITCLTMLAAAPAQAAGSKPTIDKIIVHKEVKVEEFTDDICGDRANSTTFTTTWRLIVKESGNGLSVVFGESGRYETDFVDPSIEVGIAPGRPEDTRQQRIQVMVVHGTVAIQIECGLI